MTNQPSLSIIVPVHNEEVILRDQVTLMLKALEPISNEFELLLVENGSTDHTPNICRALEKNYPAIRVIMLPIGNYGTALKEGILSARNEVCIIFNVEFWSIEFIEISLAALKTRMLVIGSKSAPGAEDDRPFLRRAITYFYNLVLKWVWDFDGTDTHGMKAFWKEPLQPLVNQCQTDGWVFDTEFVFRAQRSGYSKIELPTDVKEIRAPTFNGLLGRVPSVLKNLRTLLKYVPSRFSRQPSWRNPVVPE